MDKKVSIQEIEVCRQEWSFLMAEMRTDLTQLVTNQDSYSSLYCKLEEIDIYHRILQNNYKLAIEKLEAIRCTTRLFSDFFTEAPIGYIVLDKEGLIEDANSAASEYWAVDRYRLKGIGLFGLISGDHISILSKALEAAKLSGHRKTIDVKCIRPGGGCFWGRFDIIQTQESVTKQKRLLCSVVDITSDRVIENAIKKTAVGLPSATGASFFKQLTEFLTGYENIDYALISIALPTGKFRSIATSPNQEFEEDVFYEYSDNVRKSGFDSSFYEPNSYNIGVISSIFNANDGIGVFLFDENRNISGELAILARDKFDSKKLYSSILKVVSVRAAAEIQRYKAEEELKAHRDSLEETIDARTFELKKNNEKLGWEIEKRKAIEQNLREAKIQAEEATKAKSVFLANMSHEIRTPVNGILGVATLMKRQPLSDKQSYYVNLIEDSGNSLLHIINDILDISKLESGKIDFERKKFNLKEVLHNVCEVHYSRAEEKGLELFLKYSPKYPEFIKSDQVRIRQIVENLISNALKFTDQGYILISVNFIEDQSRLEIEIKDSGIGLLPQQTKAIFERFSQADSSTTRRFGGTGLGLSISRKLTSLLGGQIRCNSEYGKGSVFSFWIPIECYERAKEPDFVGDHKEKSFLVAMRNREISDALVQMLRDYQLDVIDIFDGNMKGYSIAQIVKEEIQKKYGCQRRFKSIHIIDGVSLPAEKEIFQFADTIEWLFLDEDKIKTERDSQIVVDKPFTVEAFLQSVLKKKKEKGSQSALGNWPDIFRDRNILLAEDNPINRVVAVDLLESLGAMVDVAEDGAAAVSLFKENKYDLILLDCVMPTIDGFRALELMTLHCPLRSPIVALTANAMKGDRERFLEAGFDEYVAKPIKMEALEGIAYLVDRKSHVGESG